MKKKKFIPFSPPWFGKEEEKEVIDTLRSGWVTTGPKTKKFEKEFAKFCGAKYAVGVNSCTAAMHLALVVAGIGEGDEVITSPMTFPTTANVIIHQGAKPVFVDIKLNTLNIDVDKIEEKITPKTRAIIPVHIAGQPCEMDKILAIAKKHRLFLLEDAAHAIGGVYRGRKIGSISDATAFSFYATKNISTGEGGMLTTNKKRLAEKVEILSLHGISKDAWKRYSPEGYQHWETLYPGYKYNMFDVQAALGIQQLKKLSKFLRLRKKYAKMYDTAFKDTPEIILLKEKKNIKHAHHLYIIMVKTEKLRGSRDEILNALQKEGIGVGVHFRALHLHSYYKKTFKFKRGDFPKAEYASDRVISLPLYPKMTLDDVKRVIKTFKQIIAKYKK